MKFPRDVSALDLTKALRVFGYVVTRQKGSHIRVTTMLNGEHHEVIPNHNPIKMGTLHSILKSVAEHHDTTAADLLDKLDL